MVASPGKDTVAIHFAAAAVAGLEPGVREGVLRAARIPAELLRQPQARVTAEQFAALWLAIAGARDDEFFGLDRRRMKVGSFGLLARAALHAADLGRALRRLLHGYRTILDDVTPRLEVEGRRAIVTLDNTIGDPAARRFADETLLVLLHGTLCWLAGRRIALQWVAFAHPPPAHAAEYRTMFTPQLRFDAPRSGFAFDARLLKAAIAQDDESLKVFLRTAPQSVFLKYRDSHSWSHRVRQRLRGALAGGAMLPEFEAVARELGLAPTTLRRRLDAEGTRFQAIKDELRRDAAIHRLSDENAAVGTIAVELGFQDASAFRRAFKKWTGAQPMHYRRT